MATIKIEFLDKTSKEFEVEISPLEIAKGISQQLAQDALAALFNDKVIDLTTPLTTNGTLKILTFDDEEGRDVFRHSTAHVLAHAIKNLYPDAKNTIGPPLKDGFYYDFDDLDITEDDFKKIEDEMNKIVKAKYVFKKGTIRQEDVRKILPNNRYKIDMAKEFSDAGDTLTTYQDDDFIDLCRGPHVPHTGKIKAFKLTKLAKAYWRGNAKNKQLTRIYGASFANRKDLKEYFARLEEAKKRDHRKLGRFFDLYSFHDEAPGMPFFHPKGMVMWNELLAYWREVHKEAGYKEIKTPILLNRELWTTSGHWQNYKENMYTANIDEMEYAIKPMNCPGGMLWFKTSAHSYRELPMRIGEIGLVHRHELSGVLSGLFRVRSFHQDDAHIFMTEGQIKDEVLGVLKLAEKIYSTFGFTYHLELSTRPEKSIGSDEAWETATNSLKEALQSTKKEFVINEGDGAFYGPKIDVHVKDAIGRTWQCATIQLDMNLPERFDLKYEGADGKKHRPVMVHRVIYGSVERFFGLLVEHYAGKFPLWLAPVQIKLLTIADRFNSFAEVVIEKMKSAGIRVELDIRSESLNKKIREAQLQQIPYILVVGEKEVESNTINVRTRDNQVHGTKKVDEFITQILSEIKEKK